MLSYFCGIRHDQRSVSFTEFVPAPPSARKMERGPLGLISATYLGAAFKERIARGTMNIDVNCGLILFETGPGVDRRADQVCHCRSELSCVGSVGPARWVPSDSIFRLLVLVVWLITLAGCTPWSPQN